MFKNFIMSNLITGKLIYIRLELMDNSDPDCKLLRDSVAPGDKTFTATSPFFTFTKHENIKIYRVKSNEPSAEG